MSRTPKKSNSHNLILNKAARDILRPLGLLQKGQSRSWIDDHGWWLGNVEFQQSSWSKGSYLNVGAMWLTYPADYFSFNEGYRKEAHVEYLNDAQFTLKAAWLVQRASEEIEILRDKYKDLKKTSELLAQGVDKTASWRCYYAATLCGLVGKIEESRRLFKQIINDEDDKGIDWVKRRREVSEQLIALLENPPKYKSKLIEFVRRTRAELKLPNVEILFS
jgi:hypothetical protein